MRETSIAVRPQARAPQKADMTAMAQAGLGWPRKVTQESRRANTQAHIVQVGYPGGWGTPAKSPAVASSPQSSSETVGAQVRK